jgi:hypothetical protein
MRLHPKQGKAIFATETSQMVAYLGGIRSGKTITGAAFAHLMISNNPEQIGIIAANTNKQLTKSTLKEFKKVLAAGNLMEGTEYVINKNPERFFTGIKSKFDEHNGVISFCNGAQILTVSLEQQVRGIEAGWQWVDEFQDSKLEELRVLQGRMSGAEKIRILYTGTPPKHNPEIEDFIWDNKDLKLITGTTFDNKRNLPKAFFDILKNYDDYTFRREVLAERVKIPGRQWMYAFNRSLHVSDKAVYRPNLPVYVSFDFNCNPIVAVLSHRGSNFIHYFDEVIITPDLVGTGTFIEAVCYEIVRRTSDNFLRGDYFVTGDASGKSQNVANKVGFNNFSQIEQVLKVQRNRMNVASSNPNHIDSRELCNAIFTHYKEIYFHPKMKRAIYDLENVAPKPDGSIKKDSRSDESQHADVLDAIRYDLHAWNGDFIFRRR